MSKIGRPKGDNNKEYNYTFRMDGTTKEQLEMYCEQMNVPKSDALRRAVDILVSTAHLDNQGK